MFYAAQETRTITQQQFDLVCGLVWLACVIVCILKLRWGLVVLGVVVSIITYVGPMITGNYVTNVLWPLSYAPVWGVLRLAHPKSYWAWWFYRNNPKTYEHALVRFGMVAELAELQQNMEESRSGKLARPQGRFARKPE